MNNAKEFYNRNSYDYVRKWQGLFVDSDTPTTYLRRRLMDDVFRMSMIGRDSKVIEIGCGTGLVLKEALKHTDRVFGVDISKAMLQRVSDSVLGDRKVAIVNNFSDVEADSTAEVLLMEGDFETLDLPKQYFDRLIAVEVLRYIDNIDKCFTYCRSIMKRDSLFVFTVTNLWSLSSFPIRHTARKRLGLTDAGKELVQYFVTENELKEKLRKAGLEVVDFNRVGFLTMNPIVRRFIRTGSSIAKVHNFETKMADVPLARNFFDTFVVAVKIQ